MGKGGRGAKKLDAARTRLRGSARREQCTRRVLYWVLWKMLFSLNDHILSFVSPIEVPFAALESYRSILSVYDIKLSLCCDFGDVTLIDLLVNWMLTVDVLKHVYRMIDVCLWTLLLVLACDMFAYCMFMHSLPDGRYYLVVILVN